MALAPHSWCTAAEAVAAFGGARGSQSFCDGQFVVLPKAVLCLATLGKAADEPCLASPSSFVWRPRRFTAAPTGEMAWFPDQAREVWDRSSQTPKRIREHHLFLRGPADTRFLYAGPADLCSYGAHGKKRSAAFMLRTRLPREVWLEFGGFPGWLIEVNHRRRQVAGGDWAAFEKLVGTLRSRKFGHLNMTRYEEDSLSVHTNRRRGWLMYLRFPGDQGLYARDPEWRGGAAALEKFECACGIDLEFPAGQTLPLDRALQAAVEFFRSGELPKSVRWESQH